MAIRPIFIASDGKIETLMTEFKWHGGLDMASRRKSIASLHENGRKTRNIKILEISTRSEQPLGVSLSAFNLAHKGISVECLYQSAKVFENGAQYLHLLKGNSYQAKKEPLLRNSGRIIAFRPFGDKTKEWGIEPPDAFYNWLYMQTLYKNPQYIPELIQYDAFTDIEFNHQKGVSSQAKAAALFCAWYREGSLQTLLSDKNAFLEHLSGNC